MNENVLKDCMDSQVVYDPSKTKLEMVSDNDLKTMRSELEGELIELDNEKLWLDIWGEDPVQCNGRCLYDVERDRDFTLSKISDVDKELSKRNILNDWLK